jgi:hypothetical protein
VIGGKKSLAVRLGARFFTSITVVRVIARPQLAHASCTLTYIGNRRFGPNGRHRAGEILSRGSVRTTPLGPSASQRVSHKSSAIARARAAAPMHDRSSNILADRMRLFAAATASI